MKRNKKSSENSEQGASSRSPHLDRDWLYQKYVVEGLSSYQIGELVSRNPKNVYNKLKDFRIPTRTRAETVVQNSWWNLGKESARKGKPMSAETKAKISAARTGKRYPNLRGEKNGMFGRTGENSPNWKGGVTPDRQKIYSTGEWKEIAKSVFERDGYRCVRCGKKSNKLHTHHVKTWAECTEGRTDIDNLITVCKGCHLWIHSKKNTNGEYLG